MAEPIDLLARATEALRDTSPADDATVDGTRRRILAAVERRPRRRWRLRLPIIGATLAGATLAWAAATDRLPTSRRDEQAPIAAIAVEVAATAKARATRSRPALAATAPAPIVDAPTPPAPIVDAPTAPAPIVDAPIVAPSPPTPRRAPRPPAHAAATSTSPRAVADAPPTDDPRDLVDYRQAHALHFRGGAPSDALAAWDAYLDQHPRGRFVAEARYNRALALVRLDRRADARAALRPFADGAVEDGYRRREAQDLLAALERP